MLTVQFKLKESLVVSIGRRSPPGLILSLAVERGHLRNGTRDVSTPSPGMVHKTWTETTQEGAYPPHSINSSAVQPKVGMEGLIRPRKVYKRGLPRAPGAEDANNDTLSYIKEIAIALRTIRPPSCGPGHHLPVSELDCRH